MLLFIPLFLLFTQLLVRPLSSQIGASAEGVASVFPVFKLVVEVSYDTTSLQPVNKTCGEYYATTFLQNFTRTESILQTKCQNATNDRLTVRHAVVARVRLLGSTVRLSTHINISISEPERFHHGNGATPWIPSPAGSPARQDKDAILMCANMINQTLLDPVSLQRNYNSQLQPEEVQSKGIDILEIFFEKNGCSRAMMNPRQIKISVAEWICPTKDDYFYDESSWECILRAALTTSTPSPPPLTTTSPTTTTLMTITTPDPAPKPWRIRILNNTGSIRLAEGDSPVAVTLSLVVNRTQLCGGQSPCTVTIEISFSDSARSQPRCRTTGDVIPQLVLADIPWGPRMVHCRLPFIVPDGDVVTYEYTRTIYLAPMLDMKYDGMQRRKMRLSVQSKVGNMTGPSENSALSLPIYIEDRDRKATCKSVNDPHITTFDGYEYNNFYEGEFVLYQHETLSYKVHVIYQKCSPAVKASCNCAVAVQTGDDVIVIDRCRRNKKPFNRIFGQSRAFTRMSIDLYLNGDLTPGTSVFKESEGKKYVIYLPHGAYVKVMVSGDLINVWIVASPKDASSSAGLCGNNDGNKNNDLQLRDGTILPAVELPGGERPQPKEFCVDWRVDMLGEDSLFRGVPKATDQKPPIVFCDCMPNRHFCGYAVDISVCDVLQGTDVTSWLIDSAKSPVLNVQRRRRSVNDNTIGVFPGDPIVVDTHFIPPEHSWASSKWNFASAQDFCNDYVKDKYRVGQLCSVIPAVDFNQEITTCIEDIQITGNTSWADSARDAMKEQCLEEVQRNGSLSSDIANAIHNAICTNDCSGHGQCLNGSCECEENWHTADCSIAVGQPPYSSELPANGLCDTRYMRCNRVIVYGDAFVDNVNLTCHLQQTQVAEYQYDFKALPHITKSKALFIDFNAVECPLPEVKPYLVSVSNDGILDHASDALLFLPFDSACNLCSTNSTSCTKRINSCRIDGKCYLENERSPNDLCLICKPFADELQWTTDSGSTCRPSWWENIRVPSWVIAVSAALGGSLVGILFGFLLYKCCCKQNKQKEEPSDNGRDSGQEESDASPCEDVLLHRNRAVPSLMDDRFLDIAFRSPEVEETYYHNNNRRIQNGIDSTTYF